MYIPLDYYRILGLPIQATSEQLRQAHRDRAMQMPRREYSDAAIASRKQLLDEAFAVLSDLEQRQNYDATFLAKTYDLADPSALNGGSAPLGDGEAHASTIEIQDSQLVGTLLILQELGEYELVLKLGRPFLTGGTASIKDGRFGDPAIVYADIVLTVALACLELGREQWQQGQYENAAEALDTGQQLLLREGLFVGVRGEIQADLYKLRPYQVLELLALPEDQTRDRQKGLRLLQEMLQERGGIDGTRDDQSGLTIDEFLRFVHQLRSYLTAIEQQSLFEAEARRPSAVATYLAVYALLARGFAERQPVLIQRSQQLLARLSARQDVYLEQSVCTLLLGQTEDASQLLDLSQEYEPIAFIREHSQGSPDLLPGLCLYAERWLQDEVFPHFRDLEDKRASLKDYFADRQVQEYLETLPGEPLPSAESAPPIPVATSGRLTPISAQEPSVAALPRPAASFGTASGRRPSEDTDALIKAARDRIAARTGVAVADDLAAAVLTMPTAERVSDTPSQPGDPVASTERNRSRDGGRTTGLKRTGDRTANAGRVNPVRWLLPLGVLFGVVTLGFVAAWAVKSWQTGRKGAQAPVPAATQPSPTVPSPAATPTVDPNAAVLTVAAAQKLVESWLDAKAAAMGTDHDISKLEQILIDPKLAYWKGQAQSVQREKSHLKYKHEVKVSAIDQSKEKPDQARATAIVSETTEEYSEAGTLRKTKTDANLQIQYDLIRKEGKWLIQDWVVQ